MADLKYGDINDDVLSAMQTPRAPYFAAVAMLAAGIGWGALVWLYQMQAGWGSPG
ncbi:hypothetical protein [Geotalea toluenoxydans]|uniref:hypothetical protein n=1 Tax=Geotalea toluenoxydans TaxID=421624 RepID=UPI000A920B62|nr:hypothetical protein [Geotalea toluenoxydans]